MDAGTFKGLKLLPLLVGIVAITIIAGSAAAGAGDVAEHHASVSVVVPHSSVETVYFGDRQQMPVRIVRGGVADPPGALRIRREVLTFGSGTGQRVAVLRGIIEPAAVSDAPPGDNAGPLSRKAAEPIDAAGYARAGTTMLRGGAVWRGPPPADLFGPADDEQLGHIADAVHGAESRYGTDLRMWRLDNPDGPQGPMQVSAAAAFDVGGGNRFDRYENILLGRAYLARLFRRYGSWSDTVAAYNWGPGNVDQWIARGRNMAQLPAETTRYIDRVLRQALGRSVAGREQQRLSER